MDPTELASLRADIEAQGQLQPIMVRKILTVISIV